MGKLQTRASTPGFCSRPSTTPLYKPGLLVKKVSGQSTHEAWAPWPAEGTESMPRTVRRLNSSCPLKHTRLERGRTRSTEFPREKLRMTDLGSGPWEYKMDSRTVREAVVSKAWWRRGNTSPAGAQGRRQGKMCSRSGGKGFRDAGAGCPGNAGIPGEGCQGLGVRSTAATFLLVLEAEQAGPGHFFVLTRPLARLQPVAGFHAAREAASGLSPGTRGQCRRRWQPRAQQRLPPGGPVAAAGARLFASARRRQQRRRLQLLIALSLLLLRVIPLAYVHSPGLSEHSCGPHGGLNTRSPTAAPAAPSSRQRTRAFLGSSGVLSFLALRRTEERACARALRAWRALRASRENVGVLHCPLSARRTLGTERWNSRAIRRVPKRIIETKGNRRPSAEGAAVRLPHLRGASSHAKSGEELPPSAGTDTTWEEECRERGRSQKEEPALVRAIVSDLWLAGWYANYH